MFARSKYAAEICLRGAITRQRHVYEEQVRRRDMFAGSKYSADKCLRGASTPQRHAGGGNILSDACNPTTHGQALDGVKSIRTKILMLEYL